MKSFKDYQSPTHFTSNVEQKSDDAAKTISAEELTKRLASAYNGKSSGNMLAQILSEAEKSKRAGTLTNEEIDAFYAQFSPMVSPSQRNMLKRVIAQLKEI